MVPRVNFSQLSRHLDLSRLSWFQLTCLLGGSAVAIWKLTNSWSVWRRNARILALIKKKRVQRDEAVRKLKTELSTSDTKVLEKRRWIVSLPARELAGKEGLGERGGPIRMAPSQSVSYRQASKRRAEAIGSSGSIPISSVARSRKDKLRRSVHYRSSRLVHAVGAAIRRS